MRDRGDHWVTVALTLLLLPARVIEEGAHAVVALPWAEEVFVRLNPRDDVVETVVQYPETTPQWAIQLAHVAPELIAAGSAVAVIAWWTVGGSVWLPASTLDWILLWLVGAQYLAIAMPEQGSPEVGES
jgi:hypothetical protein